MLLLYIYERGILLSQSAGIRVKCIVHTSCCIFLPSTVLKSATAGGVVELPEEGMEEGYGTGEGSSATGGAASKELVRRCNLHSSMVLKALGSE